MFTKEQLLRIYGDREIRKVPVGFQSIMIHRIDIILDEMEAENELSESVPNVSTIYSESV